MRLARIHRALQPRLIKKLAKHRYGQETQQPGYVSAQPPGSYQNQFLHLLGVGQGEEAHQQAARGIPH